MEIIPLKLNNLNYHSGMIVPMQSLAPSVFARELSRLEGKKQSLVKLDLKILKEKLEKAGDTLEVAPNLTNFFAYRDLIGQFAKMATSVAYKIENKSSSCGQWNHDYVSIINKEADLLYHLVMQNQLNRVTIASKLANIKGMIIKITV